MRTPTRFDDYYLIERIAVGGMAEVFKGVTYGAEGFERLSAVKRVLPHIAEDKEFIEMFIDEAKIAAQLHHPNIVQVFHLGQNDQQYFIAMEFISGQDLRSVFDRAKESKRYLEIALCVYIVKEICEALDYAHRKTNSHQEPLHLIHRDISPQNIIASYDGSVKLIDFGIAKATGKMNQTQAGILKGKFSYMSPEQARGHKIDPRSDLFALTIVLYELLTLERCFLGQSDFSTIERVRHLEYTPPRKLRRDIPSSLERIIHKGLQRDPNQRYQSAADFQEALHRFLHQNKMPYSRADVQRYMKWAFLQEIEREQIRLNEFRTYALENIPEAQRLRHPPNAIKFNPTHNSPRLEDSRPRFALRESPKISISPKAERSSIPLPSYPSKKKKKPHLSIQIRLMFFMLLGFLMGGLAAVFSWMNPPLLGGLHIVHPNQTLSQFTLEKPGTFIKGVTPALIQQLPEGIYMLVVNSKAHEPYQQQIEIKANQLIKFQPNLNPIAQIGSVEVRTDPKGVEVWINEERVGFSPLRLYHRKGVYQIRLIRKGYETQTHQVEFKSDHTQLGPFLLFPTSVQLTLLPSITTAQLSLCEKSQVCRPLGSGRQVITLLNSGETRVKVNVEGYKVEEVILPKYPKPQVQEWIELSSLAKDERKTGEVIANKHTRYKSSKQEQNLPSPSIKKQRSVTRKKPKNKRSPSQSSKSTQKSSRSSSRSSATPPPKKLPRINKVDEVESASKQPGFLKLIANPPAEVFYKGRSIGWTPIINYKMPEGTHRLTLKIQSGETFKITQVISPGQSTLRRWKKSR